MELGNKIRMLPKLSVYFGVTIDEMFDLTTEQRLHRIVKMLDMELPNSTFTEVEEFLTGLLEGHEEYRRMVYHGKIAMAEHKVQEAEEIFCELESRFPEHCNVTFELANHYAKQCDYEKALHYYEKSFELDIKQGNHPVFIDALEAVLLICEIQGQYDKALEVCDRELEHLKEEFGFTEGGLFGKYWKRNRSCMRSAERLKVKKS